MDWNSKATSWDLIGFVEEAVSSIDSVNGSVAHEVSWNKLDFSVDLKLGQEGNSGQDSVNNSKMLSSAPGSSKRARASSNGNQTVSCLVDGCNFDMSNCRDYHRRHKVCELHSKTPQVFICGKKQRFCQQCSRFHSLEEFDERKRSCRKRLHGHNKRRRKPQPDPRSCSGSYLSNFQGSQILPFSSTQVYPSTNIMKSAWVGPVNAAVNSRPYTLNHQLHSPEEPSLLLRSSTSSYEGGKQLTFAPSANTGLSNQTSSEASICQSLLRMMPFSEGSGGSQGMLYDKLTTTVQDSDRALSLLSLPPTETFGISLSNMVQQNSTSLLQPSLQSHMFDSVDSVVTNDKDATDPCPDMFSMGSDGSETLQTLPFNWA